MASKDLNIVTIVGRLTRNSEYRVVSSGTAISTFSIATNRRRRNGEVWEDEPNFFDVVFMGKGAERINQYLEKGRQVAIQGELHQRRWESETGPRTAVEIWAQEIQLLAQSSQSQTAQNPNPYRDMSLNSSQEYQVYSNHNENKSYSNDQQNKNVLNQNVPDFSQGPESFSDDDFPF